jgi:hypothetical protein
MFHIALNKRNKERKKETASSRVPVVFLFLIPIRVCNECVRLNITCLRKSINKPRLGRFTK